MHTYQTNSGEVTVMTYHEYMNKYKNIKTEIDGFKFDSKAEARYYGILKMRKMAGEIIDFEMQVPYQIILNKVNICKYIADFVVWPIDKDGPEIIDVKGFRTDIFRLKKKLFEAQYGVKIIEVK